MNVNDFPAHDKDLRALIREVRDDLRVIRDPWLRRPLAMRRRELEDELSRRQHARHRP